MTETLIRSYANSNLGLVEAFQRYMNARGLSKSTMVNYRFTVERFVGSLGPRSVVEARRGDVHNFLAALIGKGQGAASLNARTHALRLFYKFLMLGGLVTDSPMMHIGGRKVPKRVRRVLTIEEIEKLIAAARDPLERAVVEVLYATGMRVSELAALRLENIDFTGQTARIVNGKGGKDRVAVFGKHATKAMREYIDWRKPQTFLFEAPPRNGQVHPYGTRAFFGVLDRLSQRSKIGHVHPHMLRRAAATHLLDNDADIRYVQEFLGHARITTTQIYTSLTTNKLFEIYERTHPHAKSNRSKE